MKLNGAYMHNYLAIDLGAESGRTIVGSLDDGRLKLVETHRFSNQPVCLPDGLHWDVLHLWSEIKNGIRVSSRLFEQKIDSIGLDSWGVDFALLDKQGHLLSIPFHYRDQRTNGMLDEAFKRMPAVEIFASTGIQFMQINTLYQLLAMSLQKSSLFEIADRFVTIPDLFNYWMSGEITNEFTNATTTQCFDPNNRTWANDVLGAMDIPEHLFGDITEPGTRIGHLLSDVAEETGTQEISIIAPACHDTGSAVVSVPALTKDFAWISSGTWSIMGAEVQQPYVDERTCEYNFTNEGGVFGTWRLSKNIMGLWLIQECRREWSRQGEDLPYDELTKLAAEAEPFVAAIDPDYDEFLSPGDMPSRIQQYCKTTGQTVPLTKGQILRVALEGLALKYRFVLQRLEELTGKEFDTIHIFGGGIRNRLLNQFTADATGRTVITGPLEATAVGNMLMQAIALHQLNSLVEARNVVRASFNTEIYESKKSTGWDEAFAHLRKVVK